MYTDCLSKELRYIDDTREKTLFLYTHTHTNHGIDQHINYSIDQPFLQYDKTKS